MNRVIIEFSKTVEQFGLTPIESRLFVYLYLKQRPVTLDEMVEALGNSKTTMSNSVRSLQSAHLIQRVWEKGIRKNLYVTNSLLYKSFMHTYKNRWIDLIEHQAESLISLKENIPTNNQDENLKERLDEIIIFHKLLLQTFDQIDPNENYE